MTGRGIRTCRLFVDRGVWRASFSYARRGDGQLWGAAAVEAASPKLALIKLRRVLWGANNSFGLVRHIHQRPRRIYPKKLPGYRASFL
jgi:hypothetical protein